MSWRQPAEAACAPTSECHLFQAPAAGRLTKVVRVGAAGVLGHRVGAVHHALDLQHSRLRPWWQQGRRGQGRTAQGLVPAKPQAKNATRQSSGGTAPPTCGAMFCSCTVTTPSSAALRRSVLPSTLSTRPTSVTRLPTNCPSCAAFTRGAGLLTSSVAMTAACCWGAAGAGEGGQRRGGGVVQTWAHGAAWGVICSNSRRCGVQSSRDRGGSASSGPRPLGSVGGTLRPGAPRLWAPLFANRACGSHCLQDQVRYKGSSHRTDKWMAAQAVMRMMKCTAGAVIGGTEGAPSPRQPQSARHSLARWLRARGP